MRLFLSPSHSFYFLACRSAMSRWLNLQVALWLWPRFLWEYCRCCCTASTSDFSVPGSICLSRSIAVALVGQLKANQRSIAVPSIAPHLSRPSHRLTDWTPAALPHHSLQSIPRSHRFYCQQHQRHAGNVSFSKSFLVSLAESRPSFLPPPLRARPRWLPAQPLDLVWEVSISGLRKS